MKLSLRLLAASAMLVAPVRALAQPPSQMSAATPAAGDAIAFQQTSSSGNMRRLNLPLPCAASPALNGDVTSPAGSCAASLVNSATARADLGLGSTSSPVFGALSLSPTAGSPNVALNSPSPSYAANVSFAQAGAQQWSLGQAAGAGPGFALYSSALGANVLSFSGGTGAATFGYAVAAPSLSLATALPFGSGGTGAATAAGALANLSAAGTGLANVFTLPQTINQNAAPSAYNPGGQIVILGQDGGVPSMQIVGYGGAPGYVTLRQDGTGAAPAAVAAGDLLQNNGANGWDGGAPGLGCGPNIYALDAFTPTDHGALLVTKCAGPQSATGQTAFVAGEGGIGIGPMFSATAPNGAMLDVEQMVQTLTTTDSPTLGSASALGTITTSSINVQGPRYGTVVVDSEEMSQRQLNTTSLQVTARGVFGSTAAVHSCGSNCTIADVLVSVGQKPSAQPYLQLLSTGAMFLGAPASASAPAGTLTLGGLRVVGAAPALSGFGTGPTDALATSTSGDVIVGASPGTTGTVTFGAGAFTAKPVCNVWRQNGSGVSWSVTSTAISITAPAAMTAGEDVGYRCDSKG